MVREACNQIPFFVWFDVDTLTGLNFFNPENETLFNVGDGLSQCVLEANAAYNAIGDALYGFEIGNEVDGESWKESRITIKSH